MWRKIFRRTCSFFYSLVFDATGHHGRKTKRNGPSDKKIKEAQRLRAMLWQLGPRKFRYQPPEEIKVRLDKWYDFLEASTLPGLAKEYLETLSPERVEELHSQKVIKAYDNCSVSDEHALYNAMYEDGWFSEEAPNSNLRLRALCEASIYSKEGEELPAQVQAEYLQWLFDSNNSHNSYNEHHTLIIPPEQAGLNGKK